ncbi:MAG: hypothetical protein ACLUVX_13580 [Lachnospira pectinoschiza]
MTLKSAITGGESCEAEFFLVDHLQGLNKYKSWVFSAISFMFG